MTAMLGVVHIYLPYFADMDGIRMLAAQSEAEKDKTFARRPDHYGDETKKSHRNSNISKGSMWQGISSSNRKDT